VQGRNRNAPHFWRVLFAVAIYSRILCACLCVRECTYVSVCVLFYYFYFVCLSTFLFYFFYCILCVCVCVYFAIFYFAVKLCAHRFVLHLLASLQGPPLGPPRHPLFGSWQTGQKSLRSGKSSWRGWRREKLEMGQKELGIRIEIVSTSWCWCWSLVRLGMYSMCVNVNVIVNVNVSLLFIRLPGLCFSHAFYILIPLELSFLFFSYFLYLFFLFFLARCHRHRRRRRCSHRVHIHL